MKPISCGTPPPISAGDLVQVIKPTVCCYDPRYLGFVFKVVSLSPCTGSYCRLCRSDYNDGLDAVSDDGSGHDTRTLKRIPPLSESDRADFLLEVMA